MINTPQPPTAGEIADPTQGQAGILSALQPRALPILQAPAIDPFQRAFQAAATVQNQYVAPANSTPVYQPPKGLIQQSQLDSIAQRFQSLSDNHPLLTGQIDPNLASFSLNALHGGAGLNLMKAQVQKGLAGHIGTVAGLTARGLWDSTLGGWIHDMQTDPTKGILEALGVVAVTGAIVGLEVLTAGAATPFLMGGMAVLGAATTLPTLAGSFADEVSNPTDENLARLLVSTGNAYLAVGSPIKGIRGMAAARNLKVSQIKNLGNIWHNGGIMQNLVRASPAWRNALNEATPIGEQIGEIPASVDGLTAWLDKHNLQSAADAQKLLQQTSAYEAMVERFRNGGFEPAKQDQLAGEIKRFMKKELTPLRYKFAVNFGGRPEITSAGQGLHIDLANKDAVRAALEEGQSLPKSVALDHPDLGEEFPGQFVAKPLDLTRETDAEKVLDESFHKGLDTQARKVVGILRGLANGHAFGARPDLEAVLEHGGRGLASTGIRAAHANMDIAIEQMAKDAGVVTDSDWAAINDVLEDESLARNMDPEKLALARRIGWINNVMTHWETASGILDLPMGHWFPRMVVHEEGKVAEQLPNVVMRTAMTRKNVQLHRLWNAVFDSRKGEGEIRQRYQTAKELRDEQAKRKETFEQTRPERQYFLKNKVEVQGLRRAHGARKGGLTRKLNAMQKAGKSQEEIDAAKAEGEQKLAAALATLENEKGPLAAKLVGLSGRELDKTVSANPGALELMPARDALKTALFRYIIAMHHENVRSALQTSASMAVHTLEQDNGWLTKNIGAELRRGEFDKNTLPKVVTEQIFRQRGDVEREAEAAGYARVMPARGEYGTMNYKPGIFMRNDVAKLYLAEVEKALNPEDITSPTTKALYNATIAGPKRFIFLSPAWHAFNVLGRLVGFALDNPSLAGVALHKVAHLKLHDPEQYYHLATQAYMDGMVPANRFNLTEHVHHLEQERTAQPTWPGILRTPGGQPLHHAYQDMFENGFWKLVDDLQLSAYMAALEKFKQRGVGPLGLHRVGTQWSDAERGTLAAEYANKIGGMVNKQYVSRLWSHVSNMLFFAPRYWSTFLSMATSATPGATRVSNLMAKLQSIDPEKMGGLGRVATQAGQAVSSVNPIKLRAIDLDMRRELMRAQRGWFLTYMATTAAAVDGMNMIYAGHHIWDNPPGRMMDVCFDKYLPPGGTSTPGEQSHACMSGLPFFRQGADVMNAMGVGHDWGAAHLLQDESWQQADIAHKGLMMMDQAAEGMRRVGAGKISTGLTAGAEAVTGMNTYSWLATGTKQQIPRWQALLALTPFGYQAQRSLADAKQIGQDPGGAIGNIAGAEASQLTGIPSIYWMKAERKPIDDDTFQRWKDERQKEAMAAVASSNDLMSGKITPYDWWLDREQRISASLQLDKDTFGATTPSGALAKARDDLWNKMNLNDETLPREVRMQALQQFETEWDQVLQAASPDVRAAWWDKHRSQWTDADYLYWMSRQMKDGIMGSIDGQNGARIRAAQSAYGQIRNIVTDPTALEQIRRQDPYLFAYSTITKELGRMSPLGALVGAFTSPFSNTRILPAGVDSQVAAQYAASQDVLLSGASAASLAQQERQVAGTPTAAMAAGNLGKTPGFQQQVVSPQLLQAIEAYIQAHPDDLEAQQLLSQIGGR